MPISSQTADQTLLGMTPQTTTESSKSIKSTWDEELKARSVFSARTTSQKYIEMVKKHLADVASRGMTPQQAELKLKKALEDLGYSPESGFKDGGVPPAKPGEMRDLSSSRRIQLILDTNVKQAISLGQMAASEDPMLLMMHPAWELRRMGARKKPRGDWKKRWKAAGDKCGWKGALKKQMIALKTSSIWQALADGAGGFQDTLGSPYPPFAFGSGLAWASVGRKQWKQLCDKEGVNDGLDEITQKAKELKNKPKIAQPTAPTFEGVDKSFERAKTIAQPIKTAPISGLFKADFKARLKADDVIDQALADINKLRVEAGKISTEMAELREEAGKIAGPKPIGERCKLQDLITTKRSAVRDASVELDALWGRVVGYGKAVGTTPVPTDEGSQKRFNEAMARYSKAAEKTVRLAKSQLGRIEMLAAAARKTMEKLRELKVEFKADLSKRNAILEKINEAKGLAYKVDEERIRQERALVAGEQDVAFKRLQWASADYGELNDYIASTRMSLASLNKTVAEARDRLSNLRKLIESSPYPSDEASQARQDAMINDCASDVGKIIDTLHEGTTSEVIDVGKKVRSLFNKLVKQEKRRLCESILAKAMSRTEIVVGEQVAEKVAQKKDLNDAAAQKGISLDDSLPAVEEWERAYNVARSARSNVRKRLNELKEVCEKADLDTAKMAELKFGMALEYCLRKYSDLDSAFSGWRDALGRAVTAPGAQMRN